MGGEAGQDAYSWDGGQWYGSGLRGLTVTVRDAMGNLLASSSETPTAYATTSQVHIPAGATNVYFEVSAASQDPVVTGTYYSCGLYFIP